MNLQKELFKSRKRLEKSTKRLEKASAERIWIENNPHINILNYPYYKLKRMITLHKDNKNL